MNSRRIEIRLLVNFTRTPMTAGHDEQYLKAQKNKFKKLDDGVHHHKTLEF